MDARVHCQSALIDWLAIMAGLRLRERGGCRLERFGDMCRCDEAVMAVGEKG